MNLQLLTEAYLSIYDAVLNEELHPEVKTILDDTSIPLPEKVKRIKQYAEASSNELSSLRGGSGSSRHVVNMTQPTPITFSDGHNTASHNLETVLKVAKGKTKLDNLFGRYERQAGREKPDSSFGEEQNQVEGDNYYQKRFGILHQGHGSSHYDLNTSHGCILPVMESTQNGSHLVMAKAEKLTAAHKKEFKRQSGHDFNDVIEALREYHGQMFGHHVRDLSDKHQKILESEHPFIQGVKGALEDGLAPDFHSGNFGVMKLPNPSKPGETTTHIGLIDSGATNELLAKYHAARKQASRESGRY